jgi:hypothetical protein
MMYDRVSILKMTDRYVPGTELHCMIYNRVTITLVICSFLVYSGKSVKRSGTVIQYKLLLKYTRTYNVICHTY